MEDKEVLAGLKIAYIKINDILENSSIVDTKEFKNIQKILEEKYEQVYNKIKNENDIKLYYEEDLIIAPNIYNDYINIISKKAIPNEFINYSKWWEDKLFLIEF